MNHDDVRHRLSDYIDGSLADDEKTAVEEHLKTCSRCGDALKELRQTIEHIRSIENMDPPAWMTGKIMARVRADQEKKKSLFQRLFLPLHIKLPLEAMGVLFLAVTAFFIYENVRPASEMPEAPVQIFAQKEKAHSPAVDKNRRTEAAPESKPVPQKPEYKALDMKREYETPPPPVPQPGPPRPTASPTGPATRSEQPEKGVYSDQRTRAQDGAARGMINQAAPAAESQSQPDSARMGIILVVRDVYGSAEQAEESVRQLGGAILKREAVGDGVIVTVSLPGGKEQQFRERLKRIGEVKPPDTAGKQQDGMMTLEIRIVLRQPERP